VDLVRRDGRWARESVEVTAESPQSEVAP